MKISDLIAETVQIIQSLNRLLMRQWNNLHKKYYNLFDNKVPNFVNRDALEQQIEHNFQQQIGNVRYDHPFRSAKINLIKKQNSGDLDALEALNKEKM